ncbi:MAG: hypothetical protein II932_06725, partial [Treponema sp.]|nr:hypothetical protein [Treponema sp.]
RTAATDTVMASYYAPAGTDPKTDTEFTFEIDNKSDFPADAKWKLVAGSRAYGVAMGTSAADTGRDSQLTYVALNSLTDTSLVPYTTNDITLIVEHPSYESAESDALKFKVYPPPPASIAAFETSCDCSGTCLDGSMSYQVTASSAFTAIISSYFSVLPAANSGAVFKWYAVVGGTRTLVGTRDSSGNLPLSMADLGIDVSTLPSDFAGGSDGPPLTVYFEYEVSFPGTTLTRTGSPSSTGYLYLFQ